MVERVNVISLNVRGISDNQKRRDIFHWLKNKRASVYFLQETHSIKNTENIWRSEWGFDAYFSSFTSNSAGVAILLKNNIEFKVHECITSDNGRFVILDVTIEEFRLTIVNLYGYNQDRPDFFNNIFEIIDKIGNDNVILGGDWNVVQDKALDTHNIKTLNNIRSNEIINRFKIENDFIDPWRVINPDLKQFTWRRSNPLKQSRIDFFFVSQALFAKVNECKILTSYRTDHSAIFLKFTVKDIKGR